VQPPLNIRLLGGVKFHVAFQDQTTSKRARKGMSLLEILTALLIVGVLAALVIPIVGKIQATARNTECISNLRQVGLAMNTYAAENGGRYPHAYAPPGDQKTWMWKLAPYVGLRDDVMGPAPKPRSVGIFVCPEWKKQSEQSTNSRNLSYGISRYIDPDTRPAANRYWNYQPNRVSSKTILVAEIDVNNEFAYAEKIERRHPHESANYLFVDGHVENLREIINGNDPRWYQ